ncbi:Laccase domain protein YfiH [bacterium HR39]|nr:Laccase domain protein YfiH [bacterium HR39]
MVRPVISGLLRAAGLCHGFFTREGGVSEGPYASLNVGLRSGDDPQRVRENRARIARALDVAPERLVTARQVHGTEVVLVEDPFPPEEAPEADALVVERPGLAIGVTTADCAPVLLFDPFGLRAAAVHAGWCGLAAGILERTVGFLRERGTRPHELRAAVGPCIGARSYEVGGDVHEAFLAVDPAHAADFRPLGQGRFLFDLAGAARRRLLAAGLEPRRVEVLGLDTFAREELFFSYRRTRLRGEARFGLQLSALVLRAPEV